LSLSRRALKYRHKLQILRELPVHPLESHHARKARRASHPSGVEGRHAAGGDLVEQGVPADDSVRHGARGHLDERARAPVRSSSMARRAFSSTIALSVALMASAHAESLADGACETQHLDAQGL
jgi:hypothetical protein